jgi:hypothetical protein
MHLNVANPDDGKPVTKELGQCRNGSYRPFSVCHTYRLIAAMHRVRRRVWPGPLSEREQQPGPFTYTL